MDKELALIKMQKLAATLMIEDKELSKEDALQYLQKTAFNMSLGNIPNKLGKNSVREMTDKLQEDVSASIEDVPQLGSGYVNQTSGEFISKLPQNKKPIGAAGQKLNNGGQFTNSYSPDTSTKQKGNGSAPF